MPPRKTSGGGFGGLTSAQLDKLLRGLAADKKAAGSRQQGTVRKVLGGDPIVAAGPARELIGAASFQRAANAPGLASRASDDLFNREVAAAARETSRLQQALLSGGVQEKAIGRELLREQLRQARRRPSGGGGIGGRGKRIPRTTPESRKQNRKERFDESLEEREAVARLESKLRDEELRKRLALVRGLLNQKDKRRTTRETLVNVAGRPEKRILAEETDVDNTAQILDLLRGL